jgi:glutamate synthase domain-containing protein 3
MLRIGFRILAASALASTCLLGVADATRTVRITSHISIKAHQLDFRGKVTSSNTACKDGRHVSLYRRLSGGGRQRLGTDVTGASGKWHVTVSGFAGVSLSNFYAKVRRRAEGTAGTIYVCKSAHSKTIAFQP